MNVPSWFLREFFFQVNQFRTQLETDFQYRSPEFNPLFSLIYFKCSVAILSRKPLYLTPQVKSISFSLCSSSTTGVAANENTSHVNLDCC